MIVSPDTLFNRRNLFALDSAERESVAREFQLPFLSSFSTSIARLQTARDGGNVRGYLRHLVRDSSFTIVSPYSGQILHSGGSLLLADKTIVFSFPAEPTLLLGVGDISLGFPICAALLTDRNLILGLIATDWGFSERHLPGLASAIESSAWSPAPAVRPLHFVIGDQNFAHHAWNELSALHELVADDLPPDIRLIATQQPLGPIREIFPQLSHASLSYIPDAQLENLNAPGFVFAPVGGRKIGRQLVDRILTFARARMSASCREVDAALAATRGPILWMSVRSRNRTLTNQHDVLASFGRDFLRASSCGAIVLDGFSLPADFATSPPYHQEEANKLVAEDRSAAEAVRESIEAKVAGAQVHLAVGMSITDSISLSGNAAIYFCHHGTVQHKIGWFHSIPGMVHCNSKILRSLPASWVAAQSEVALPPFYIPETLVRDADLPTRSYAQFDHLLHSENYTIADIPASTAAFLNYAADQDVPVRMTQL